MKEFITKEISDLHVKVTFQTQQPETRRQTTFLFFFLAGYSKVPNFNRNLKSAKHANVPEV